MSRELLFFVMVTGKPSRMSVCPESVTLSPVSASANVYAVLLSRPRSGKEAVSYGALSRQNTNTIPSALSWS